MATGASLEEALEELNIELEEDEALEDELLFDEILDEDAVSPGPPQADIETTTADITHKRSLLLSSN